MIRLVNPKKGKRNFYLMAPSKEILDAVVKKLDGMLALREATSPEALDAGDTSERAGDVSFAEMSLVEYPTGSSKLQQFFFITLFPFRFLMHWTVPDVQVFDSQGNPTSKVSTAFIAIGGCLLWLIVGSYAMVASLERLADLMGVPASVVGVTVSAAGTSLPNYVASKIAAEKGFGVSIRRSCMHTWMQVVVGFIAHLFIHSFLSSLVRFRTWLFQTHSVATRSTSWSAWVFRGFSTRVLELVFSLTTASETKASSRVSKFLARFSQYLLLWYFAVVLCCTNGMRFSL